MKARYFFSILAVFASITFAKDSWVTTGRDAEYPMDFYFVGVGVSERGLDAAKQNAIVEIKKQISVKVNASMLDEQTSLTSFGKEIATNRIESRARLVTSGDLQGAEIAKTLTQGKLTYALAVLDKKNFISNTRAKISELKTQLAKLVEGANTDIAAAKIGSALDKLSNAKKAINEILDLRTMLSAATEITQADQLTITTTDISALYEKCISSVRMTKVSGDNQVFPVGLVPSEALVVSVKTADGSPVPMLPLSLLDGNKRLIDKYTDDNGKADFFLGEKADMSAGSHSYTAAISLRVSSAAKKFLTAQNQTFSYTVQSNPCFAKIQVTVSPSLSGSLDEVSKKLIARLAKYDLKDDASATNILKLSLLATDAGGVAGLSENNSFVKTEVTLSMLLVDDDEKQLASLTGSGKGLGGSLVKSALQGVENIKIEKDLKSFLEKVCNAKPSSPKLRIAIFDFKNRGYYNDWYDMSINLSDMLITKLINSGKFDVVERTQLDKIMEEKSLAQSGVVEEKEAMSVAQLAGADVILIGSVNIISSKIEADARIVDCKNGIAKCAMSSSSYAIEDLRSLSDDLAGQIKGKCTK